MAVVALQQVGQAASAPPEESAPSKKWWHVADAEIERMLAEKQRKDEVWWPRGGDVESWSLEFFFWGGRDEKSVPNLFDSLFLGR